ncbi:DNA translocase FtsK [Fictibacillus macauensis ZFHKF-1]|uniref:DNA translocase FtsK n=1 Tax=Fictibacillus macauensis ZFHKF-1 TaxID=1196324 RepID=I8J2C1_9BACL|nr:FtsK/SpoIIIE domain-containing protein [Fictibacillus macauensis]EIT85891.1 DNA translocase FtsK [Fictibacillus macauensis ZFHKF-1]
MIVSTIALGSIAIYAKVKSSGGGVTADSQKLQQIFTNSGLNITKSGKTFTTQLLKKRKKKWGTEYVYRIPLGRSFGDYEEKIKVIEDGLNAKSKLYTFNYSALKELDFKKKLGPQLKKIFINNKPRKEIELLYDGTLKIRIYNTAIPTKVLYRDLDGQKAWSVPVGAERYETIYHDFDTIPHMLVGGATGGGKSSFLDMFISHFIYTQPEHAKFTLIDLKGGIEFDRFRNCKQVVDYAEHPEEALEALRNVVAMMKETLATLKEKGARNVIDAGIKERHFIVIDEIGELASAKEVCKETKKIKEECEYLLSNIARLGRSQGIKLVTATQHPTVDVVPVQVKRNSDARLCFRVDGTSASMTILDAPGADKLPDIKGRAIYKRGADKYTLQTPWLPDKEMEQIIGPNIVIRSKPQQEESANESKTRNDFVMFEQTGLSDQGAITDFK